MCENHSPGGKKKAISVFQPRRYQKLHSGFRVSHQAKIHRVFKSCYGHGAHSHHTSFSVRDFTSVMTQTENQKSPSEQLN